jgi:hypothetical protein
LSAVKAERLMLVAPKAVVPVVVAVTSEGVQALASATQVLSPKVSAPV